MSQKDVPIRLWENARILSMTGGWTGGHVAGDGAVLVQGEHILAVGPRRTLAALPEATHAERFDCEDRLLLPGLIDCHTHLVFAGSRAAEFEQRLNGVSYREISEAGGGIRATVAATRQSSESELTALARSRVERLSREGVTSLEVKSGYGLDAANEQKMLRAARALETLLPVSVHTTFLGAHTVPEEFEGQSDAYIDLLCEEMLPSVAEAQLADSVDAFCETIAFDVGQVGRVFAKARKLGLPVRLHADQLTDCGGAALAAQFDALSADHLEYTSEAGVRAMARSGTVAVLLPGAFYYLHETQKPPLALLRKHAVPIALATDCNPGSSPVDSLLLVLNMGCVLFGLTPGEAIAGVTIHAARALGLTDRGVLAPGKRADFALFDIDSPAELCYAIGAPPPVSVVRSGNPVGYPC